MSTGSYEFTAVLPGASGNGTIVDILNTGIPNQPASIAVVVKTITVTPATDGAGDVSSLTSDIKSLLDSTPAAAALVITAITLAGTSPSGSVTLSEGSGAGGSVGRVRAVGIKIKDWNGKYYMNDYVPLDLIFGFDNSQTPGLLYPEIYIPRQQNIFFDLIAYPTGGGLTGTVTLTHKGQKV